MNETETTQDNCRRLVDNHVYHNVSYLVQELSKDEKYMDELMEVQVNYCEDDNVEEALEHWLVSDWLANRLREHNEMVIDFMGLTIWGRQESGQMIALDAVIQSIYQKHYA